MIQAPHRRATLLVGVATILTTSLVFGAPKKPSPKPAPAPAPAPAETGWQLDLNTGISLSRGNTDSFGLSIGLDAERRWNGWQAIGKANYDYTELNKVTTGNALRLGLQLNRDLNDRWFLGIANSFTYDEIANLDYRYQIASVFGFRAWTTEQGSLTLEAGPGYSWERQARVTSDYAIIRFAERFKYVLSKNTRFVQSLEYIPSISDFSRYTIVAEAGITARISGNLWWRNAVRDIYNSNAPAGLKKNDLQLTTGLTWGLGDPDAAAAPKKKVRKKSDVTKPAAAPSRPEGLWQTTAALGFSLAKGNSDNLLLTGDIASNMVSKPNEYAISLGGAYGEVQKVRSVQNFHADAQFNRLVTDRFYVGAGASYLKDDIATLDYRITPAVFFGYKLVDTDRTSLRIEGGPGYTWEKLGGVKNDYVTMVIRERFEHALNDTAKVWQSETMQFDVSNTKKFILTSELGIAFWLTDNISLRTVASDVYDNIPAAGRKSNDLRLTSGIAVSF